MCFQLGYSILGMTFLDLKSPLRAVKDYRNILGVHAIFLLWKVDRGSDELMSKVYEGTEMLGEGQVVDWQKESLFYYQNPNEYFRSLEKTLNWQD